MKLSELIKQKHFASPAQEAVLNIIVTSSWLTNQLTAVMAPYDITPAQYNVLRILKGSYPDKMTCSAIGDRLLDRTPDVTRLLNRLQRRRLIHRERAEHDRRVVEVSLTDEGAALLEKMGTEVERTVVEITRHLSEAEHEQLVNLLERVREDQVA